MHRALLIKSLLQFCNYTQRQEVHLQVPALLRPILIQSLMHDSIHMAKDIVNAKLAELRRSYNLYTVLRRVAEKNKRNYFCYNYVKLPPNLIIFGTTMGNGRQLYDVHSFFTSHNSRQCTTVLNADTPNCYISLYL